MKKWQKTVGIIVFALIAIYELLIWVKVESNGNNFLTERMYMRIGSLSFGMWLNFALTIFLFICLWRKGGRQ